MYLQNFFFFYMKEVWELYFKIQILIFTLQDVNWVLLKRTKRSKG